MQGQQCQYDVGWRLVWMLSLNIRVYNGREAIVELAKMIVEERRK